MNIAEGSATSLDDQSEDHSSEADRRIARLEAENRVLRSYLATNAELSLAGEGSLDDQLQRIVDTARSLLGARYGALGVFDAAGRVTRFFVSGVSPEVVRAIGRVPCGAGLLGYIVKERRFVRAARLAEHPSAVGFPPNHPPMTSFLGGPIERNGTVYGHLYLTDRIGASEFSAADEDLLAVFSRKSAIAIENAQRLARARLEQSSLESIFDSLRDAVVTTDSQDRIVRVNRQAAAWSDANVLGKRVEDAFTFLAPDGSPREPDSTVASEELQLRLPDGGVIPIERVVSPIRDGQGQDLGTVQVLRDLRPQREVEQLKANIISLVSHELRTPLSHIKGYASTLLQPDVEWDAETQKDFISSIERQADRLARLISDLLEISRLDAGGTAKMEKVAIVPKLLIERGLRQAAANVGDHPVLTEIAPNLLPVRADPGHVERVLTNLIENAAKYSPAGAPIVVLVEPGAGEVVFSVVDQGSGLTDGERSHLFERFYRSPRVKHRTPGTGLGLAICREIVVAHGGRIWVDSVEGQGSRFSFSLPTDPEAG